MNIKSLVVGAAVGFGMFVLGGNTSSAQTGNTDIDEDFELNITERRITETDFVRSTRAELSAENIRLQVGVGAEARRIDVILRGVTGRVRFRASLEQIRQRIARLRSELNSR